MSQPVAQQQPSTHKRDVPAMMTGLRQQQQLAVSELTPLLAVAKQPNVIDSPLVSQHLQQQKVPHSQRLLVSRMHATGCRLHLAMHALRPCCQLSCCICSIRCGKQRLLSGLQRRIYTLLVCACRVLPGCKHSKHIRASSWGTARKKTRKTSGLAPPLTHPGGHVKPQWTQGHPATRWVYWLLILQSSSKSLRINMQADSATTSPSYMWVKLPFGHDA
jgi:hypothetical protein